MPLPWFFVPFTGRMLIAMVLLFLPSLANDIYHERIAPSLVATATSKWLPPSPVSLPRASATSCRRPLQTAHALPDVNHQSLRLASDHPITQRNSNSLVLFLYRFFAEHHVGILYLMGAALLVTILLLLFKLRNPRLYLDKSRCRQIAKDNDMQQLREAALASEKLLAAAAASQLAKNRSQMEALDRSKKEDVTKLQANYQELENDRDSLQANYQELENDRDSLRENKGKLDKAIKCLEEREAATQAQLAESAMMLSNTRAEVATLEHQLNDSRALFTARCDEKTDLEAKIAAAKAAVREHTDDRAPSIKPQCQDREGPDGNCSKGTRKDTELSDRIRAFKEASTSNMLLLRSFRDLIEGTEGALARGVGKTALFELVETLYGTLFPETPSNEATAIDNDQNEARQCTKISTIVEESIEAPSLPVQRKDVERPTLEERSHQKHLNVSKDQVSKQPSQPVETAGESSISSQTSTLMSAMNHSAAVFVPREKEVLLQTDVREYMDSPLTVEQEKNGRFLGKPGPGEDGLPLDDICIDAFYKRQVTVPLNAVSQDVEPGMETALDGNRQLKETLSPNEYWCLMWSVDHISKIPVLAQKTSDRPTRSVHTPQNPQASQIGPEPGAFQDEQMEKTSRPRDEHGPSAETFEKTEAPQTALIQAGDKISGIPHRNLTDTMNQSNLAPGTEARGLEASSIPAFHDGVGSCQTPRPSQRSGSQETRAAPGGSYLDNKPVTRDNAHSARTSAPPLQLGSQASSNPPRDPRLKPVSSNPPLQLGSQAPSNLPRDPRLKPVSSNKAWNSRRGRRGRGGY